MTRKLSSLFSWFTYRPKWYLETIVEDLLTAVSETYTKTLAKTDSFKQLAEELSAENHTATASILRSRRTSLEEKYLLMTKQWSENAMHADRNMLRAMITEIEQYKEKLGSMVFEYDLEALARQETALRREIGDKVRGVDRLKADITVMMLQKLGMLTVHDTEPIVDFAMIIKDWSDLANSPRIHTFDGLKPHLHTLTHLNMRMHELKTTLLELH